MTAKTTITFPPLGSRKDYNFVTRAERSDQLVIRLKKIISDSEERIEQAISTFRSQTNDSLKNVTLESDHLTHSATANRAVKIRKDEMEKTQEERTSILRELLEIDAEVSQMAPMVFSPQMLLLNLTLDSDRRLKYAKMIEGANESECDAFALRAVSNNDKDLGAALSAYVSTLPKDRRPSFSANALAEVFMGQAFEVNQRAISTVGRNPGFCQDLDRALRTGQKPSVHAALSQAAARMSQSQGA